MSSYSHVCIAYVVGRLIAGKSVTAVYDCDNALEIVGSDLPDEDCLTNYRCINWSFMEGPPGIFRFQHTCKGGYSFDLSIKGNTFVCRVREDSADLIGKVQGDSVFLYDRKHAARFNYRITGNAIYH